MSEAAAAAVPGVMSARAARLVALLVAATFFMEYLDGSVLATALPAIGRDFQVGPVSLGIGISAYLLTLAVFIPVSGWVADRYGTRSVFISAIAIFTAASILCAASPGLWPFVASRVLQGVGGALMVPVGRLVVLRTTEKANLVQAISLLTWPALTAPILGPPVGGFLVAYATWHWIFLINVPVGIAAIVLARRWMPNLQSGERRPFDWPGFALTGAALACFMEGLELLGQPGLPWWTAGGLLAFSIAVGVVAVRHAGRAKYPMLDLTTMRIPTFAASQWAGTVFRTCISTAPFLLPLMFQVGFGLDALHAGLLMLAVYCGNLGMKFATVWILRTFGHRTAGLATAVLAALAMLACAALYPSTSYALLLPVLALGGLTRSMQFTILQTLSYADVPPARMSAASSLSSVSVQVSMGMGVALGAALLHVVAGLDGRSAATLPDFHLTFVLVAALSTLGIPLIWRLPRDAGAAISGFRGP